MKFKNLVLFSMFLVALFGLASLASATTTVTLNSPANNTAYYNVSQGSAVVINFTCTPFDDSGIITGLVLYTNMTGSWQDNVSNESIKVANNGVFGFVLNITKSQDIRWNCMTNSSLNGNVNATSNFTLIVDLSAPTAFDYGNFTTDITRVTGNKTVSTNLTPLLNWSQIC